jgi:(R,R)-butanediol dehydrogenase / meso-butanediol dehydrogenase / diacetyl reductase
MKAAIFHDPYQMSVRSDVPIPEPAADEVIVKVEVCGICGSDLHLYRTNAHRGPSVLRATPQGEIPGHEYSGTVFKVGSNVKDYAVGDRVVGVTGGGGFAEYVPVPTNPFQIAHMPDNVSFAEAATTEPLADSLQMVRLANIQAGENVVVFGVGIIGLGVIQALHALAIPAAQIVAIDVSAARLTMALEVGATATINPRMQNLQTEIKNICGFTALTFPHPDEVANVAVVIDCAGYLKHMTGPAPLESALQMLQPGGGRIICFGAYEGPVTADLMPLINKQAKIFGSMGYAAAELQQALALMAAGKVDRRKLISSQFHLDQIVDAFETQGNGSAIKVMVSPC